MSLVVVLIHVGLYLAIAVLTLALCVLHFRISKLNRLMHTGSVAHSLIGFEVSNFQVVNARSGESVALGTLQTSQSCLLLMNSGCNLCQQLIQELKRQSVESLTVTAESQLMIYCEGAERGCLRALEALNSSITILIKHNTDLTTLLPVGSVPALLEMDQSGRVIRHTYPFCIADILTVLSASANHPQ